MSVTNFFYNKEYGHQWPIQNLFLDLHYDFITIKTHDMMMYNYVFMRYDTLKINVHGRKHNGKSLNSVRTIEQVIH